MTGLLLVASAAMALLAVLLLRAARAGRTSRDLSHLAAYQQLGRPGSIAVRPENEALSAQAVATLESIGSRVLPRLGATRTEKLRHQLRGAGLYGVTAEAYAGARVALTGAGLLLAVLVGASSGAGAAFFFAAAACFFGYAVPTVVVSRRSRLRTATIDRQMPELVDLLVVAVEAGLGLGAAIDRAALRM